MRCLDGITNSMDESEQVVVVVGGGDERESLRYCRYMGSQSQ